MLDYNKFEQIIHNNATLQPSDSQFINTIQSNVRAWSADLSMKSQEEQYRELEKILNELVVIQMPDNERVELMGYVFRSIERVIGQLHQQYIYEVSVITKNQQRYVDKVKSLYHLSILVYKGVVVRESLQRGIDQGGALSWFKLIKNQSQSTPLLLSLYNLANIYMQLLMEQSLTYQKSPTLYWEQLNWVYRMAYTKGIADTDLQRFLHVNGSRTITDVYCQSCLHSLLGLASYRRQDIIGIHKLLPTWSKQVRLTQEPHLEHRLFVDLNDAESPMHLSPQAKVNPYEDNKLCLFIDISALQHYLKHLTQQPIDSPKRGIQVRLANMAWHSLNSKSARREKRYVSYDTATIVSGFNLIHYYMSGKKSLSTLIHQKSLPRVHFPKYNTTPKQEHAKSSLEVEVVDTSTTGCRFKWQVSAHSSENNADSNLPSTVQAVPDKPAAALPKRYELDTALEIYDLEGLDFLDSEDTEDSDIISDSPYNPVTEDDASPNTLQVLSLFAMQIHPADHKLKNKNKKSSAEEEAWQIGLVRWVEKHDNVVEAGGRIIGYSTTACGLRLESKDQRSQDFVPALLLAGDVKLGTKTTLLVPRYHFRLNDKVMLRIGEKQTLLRLNHLLLSPDDFEQYEILRIVP